MAGVGGLVSLGIEQSGPTANVAGGRGEPKLMHVTYADRGLLPTLGVHLLLGRNFSAAEDSPHGPPVVILTWDFWQRRFGGTSNVIDRTLEIDGRVHTIVGVLPKSYAALGFEGDIVLPTALPPNDPDDGSNYIAIVGRHRSCQPRIERPAARDVREISRPLLGSWAVWRGEFQGFSARRGSTRAGSVSGQRVVCIGNSFGQSDQPDAVPCAVAQPRRRGAQRLGRAAIA
jgi:hypothetical protein